MTKATLVAAILAAAPDIASKAEAERAIDAVVKGIGKAVRDGEKVILNGFGTFEKKHKLARTGRNPATGESIEVPAKTVLGFKPKLPL